MKDIGTLRSLVVVALLALGVGASSAEHTVQHATMDQLPPAVKATLQRESAGGEVGEIYRAVEDGKTSYEAVIVKERGKSYLHLRVSENGRVLTRETRK